VAGEVRALALRSADAAREIGSLIQEVVGIAQAGVARTREAADAMGDVLERNQGVSELVRKIHQAGREQSGDLLRIQQTFAQLGDLTRGNAAMAEQSSHSLLTMDAQTHNLAQAASVFRREHAPARA